MSDLHVAVGVPLVTLGTVTGGYLAYKLHATNSSAVTARSSASVKPPTVVLLSETLAAVAIGILHIYTYACCTSCLNTAASLNRTRNTANETIPPLDCEVNVECTNREILMDQIALTATAIHCLLSLITSSFLCKKCVFPRRNSELSSDVAATTSDKMSVQRRDLATDQTTIGLIISHWLLPTLTVFCLYYSMQMADVKQLCQNVNVAPNIVDTFHSLVSELLDNPLANMSDQSMHETEINSIVGRVYSIVESATENGGTTQPMTDMDEGFSVLDIMNRLHSVNKRVPKQLKFEQNINTTGFKVYTLCFILLGFVLPLIYANMASMKLKLQLDTDGYGWKELMRYLNLSIISVLTLWTPSFVETFSRTYITESQPSLAMQILVAIGSVHMIFRNGLNVKLLKILSGQSNSVQPKA